MTNFGKIKSYDAEEGVGTIAPEQGGVPLAFDKTNLRQASQVPRVGQRFGYETHQRAGGESRAVNLQLDEQKQGQA